ncbi:DUF2848 domain-containing protein [Cohaesibacter sp. CAU 1516]|uniref:DUF2848 domain-containing protein n=1 Tax=Cohaesibacter sp. CAU 1516 TaxID=2576038 RepID=UPI001FF0275B|nr:DUF2848 domain-containing protein [Cohaesibacter sp. CAU 1516]
MQFHCNGTAIEIAVDQLIVAGWTGRNIEAVQHHIDELAAIGVAPPSTVPLYYRVSNALLTQDDAIQVVGEESSGEVEPLLLKVAGNLYLGLGSDHTDRGLEAHSVAASKQICAKPVASEVWAFDEVADHLDQIELKCSIKEDGAWVAYQDGTLASIRPLAELMAGADFADNMAMLCGTLGAIGGVRPASDYKMEMVDPVLGRSLAFGYQARNLPVIS